MDSEGKLVPLEPKAVATPETLPPAHYSLLEPAPRDTHLLDYLVILRKHQWLIVFFLLTVLSIVTISSFKMRPVYEAGARVEVDRENTNLLPFQNPASYDVYWDLENYIETQAKILQSETLALHTIKSLNLVQHPDFGGGAQAAADLEAPSRGGAAQKRSPLLGAFLGRLTVRRVPNSRLLDVRFESYDPQLAARAVNVHLENFIEQNFRSKYEATTQASNFLSRQLEELKIKVEKSEDTRLAYERQHQIWTIDEKQNITTQKLSDLNKELTLAQAERIQKESNYQLARAGTLDAVPAVRDSEAIRDLEAKRNELQTQHSEAITQFGPKYPKVLRIEAQIRELGQLIQREKLNVISRIEAEFRVARQREKLLS